MQNRLVLDGVSSATELVAAVHELGDQSAPQPGRLAARQKLKKFIFGLGGKVGDIAIGLLQAYIESQLGF